MTDTIERNRSADARSRPARTNDRNDKPRATGRPGRKPRPEAARTEGDAPRGPGRTRSRGPKPDGGAPSGGRRARKRGAAAPQRMPGEGRLPELPQVEAVDPGAFAPLGIEGVLLEAVGRMGYGTPTPIQEQAIPLALQGRDVVGLAQTGTGKTAAFGLPLVAGLIAENDTVRPRSVRALILAPTRELAGQIVAVLRGLTKGLPFSVNLVVGGASINGQARQLERGTDVLVATPGRLLDLAERGAVRLSDARQLVLDEADQMLDMGFIHDLKRIAKMLGTPRRTMLFSATMPTEIEALAARFLSDPVRVEVAAPGKPADKIEQSAWFAQTAEKADLLTGRIQDALKADRDARALVFCRTKRGAERLMKTLVARGINAASIHGNKSQGQRDRALADFRAARVDVLVATDVAARGIDVPGVSHVYNYELPNVPEAYVHRIGRTARAGAEGAALSYVAPDELSLLWPIERLLGITIPTAGGERPERRGRGTGPKPGGRPTGRPNAGRPGGNRRGPPRAGGSNRSGGEGREGGRSDGGQRDGEGGRPRRTGGRRPRSA